MPRCITPEPLRTDAEPARTWPAWYLKLAMRLSQLQQGHAYDVTVIVPAGGGEPVWIVRGGAKVENEAR